MSWPMLLTVAGPSQEQGGRPCCGCCGKEGSSQQIGGLLTSLHLEARSLIWHKNSRGPRTVPCGTPESTLTDSDSSPSKTTFIFLFVKKSRSQELILPSTP